MRCFVALGLEKGPGAALASWLEATRAEFPELAVTPAENLHLTLAFLGATDTEGVEAAGDAVRLAAAANRGFAVRWTEPGAFPSATRPRVLWLGVDGGAALGEVHGALTEALSGAGLPIEARAFSPHLTLARVRRGEVTTERRQQILAHLETAPAVGESMAVSLVLYESRLGGGPAVHLPLVVVPLRVRPLDS